MRPGEDEEGPSAGLDGARSRIAARQVKAEHALAVDQDRRMRNDWSCFSDRDDEGKRPGIDPAKEPVAVSFEKGRGRMHFPVLVAIGGAFQTVIYGKAQSGFGNWSDSDMIMRLIELSQHGEEVCRGLSEAG